MKNHSEVLFMSTANPSIRIFISSTFLDMQNERDVLNQDVFPVIKGALDQLGVDFTIVDLRWGITKEDQIKNNVIDLCLEEINHCKPYFIGLIGNRYGWCPDHLEEDLLLKYPFIKDNQDKSVTEFEMLLGALMSENRDRCFFYFKDKALFDESTSDHKDEELKDLKSRIQDTDIKNHRYTSFDEFKELVLADLLKAIEEDYPSKESTSFIKQASYLNLIENRYVNRLFMTAQAIDIIAHGEQNHVAVLAYSPDPIGKSDVFNHVINSKKDADKIIINLKADLNLQHFPVNGLYKLIVKGLEDLGIELVEYKDLPEIKTQASYESLMLAKMAILKKNLYNLKLSRPLYILINDIDLLYDNDISQTFFRHFLFDNNKLPDNLYVFMTTNSEKQTKICEKLTVYPMHEDTFGCEQFLQDYLAKYAKKIDKDILALANKNLKFIDYKLIADYLIYYCNFSSYKEMATALVQKNNTNEILMYILNDFLTKLSPKCASLLAEILMRLVIFEIGMSESMLFDSYNKDTAIEEIKEHQVYVEISEVEKASIMRALRYFTNYTCGVIIIEDNVIKNFLKKNINYLFDVVSASYDERSKKAVNDLFDEVDIVTKYGRQYTKEEYLELLKTNNEKTRNIEYAILDPLCAYLNKIIEDYAKSIDEDNFYSSQCDDKEASMLAFIDESARLYKINTRLDLYQKLLMNKNLIFFVAFKSKTLLRKLIVNYIELYISIMQKQYSKVRGEDIVFAIDYCFNYLLEEDEEDWMVSRRNIILTTLCQILYEKELYGGKCVEYMEELGQTFQDIDDFGLTCASDDTYEFLYDVENQFLQETDEDALRNYLLDAYQRYKIDRNINDKIVDAYYAFKIILELADNEIMTDDDYSYVTEILKTIEGHLSYCFYPEVFAFFDMYFGRLFPNHVLYRINYGMSYLKSIGYQRSLESYKSTLEYFQNK